MGTLFQLIHASFMANALHNQGVFTQRKGGQDTGTNTVNMNGELINE